MAASSEFFGQRNSQAVLKHGILTRYAHYFAGRAGKATQDRVAFIDGYAGAGRYEDGSPGSPLLLASRARRSEMLGRDVRLAFVEHDGDRRERLKNSLAAYDVEPDQLLGDRFQDVADSLLDRYDRHAVLLFVDPFGLGIDRATLTRILRRSSAKQPIDVLYHFSLSSVMRMGPAAIRESSGSEKIALQLDATLGPIGWRKDFETALSPGTAAPAALAVARRFGDAIRESTGLLSTSIPVRQRPEQSPKYLLMLFSRNERAHWDFADVASKAHVDWLHHCDTSDYAAHVREDENAGLMTLFEEAAPDINEIEDQLRRDADAHFQSHLPELFRRHGSLRPVAAIEDVYGEMLGRARVTHLRSAFKALHSAALIDDDGKGDFWMRTVRWLG